MFQFPRFASVTYGFSGGRLGITPAGFPHSGILGSKPACGSPRLIAASHALHRFLAPRHPPFALSSLTTNFYRLLAENIAWLHSRINVFGCQRAVRPEPRHSDLWLYRFSPGGDDRSRTGDPLLAKQVLSQLSYIPLSCISKAAILVGLPGVEPGTSRLSSARSSQLS